MSRTLKRSKGNGSGIEHM